METSSTPDHQETKFEKGMFGHLVENYNPFRFVMLVEKNPSSEDQFRSVFATKKEDLLSLCVKPEVNISPEQGEVIKEFLDEIYEFPNKEVLLGDEWMKVNNEKQLILATYINSLQK